MEEFLRGNSTMWKLELSVDETLNDRPRFHRTPKEPKAQQKGHRTHGFENRYTQVRMFSPCYLDHEMA